MCVYMSSDLDSEFQMIQMLVVEIRRYLARYIIYLAIGIVSYLFQATLTNTFFTYLKNLLRYSRLKFNIVPTHRLRLTIEQHSKFYVYNNQFYNFT